MPYNTQTNPVDTPASETSNILRKKADVTDPLSDHRGFAEPNDLQRPGTD